MSQRMFAVCIAAPLLLALGIAAVVTPLPYAVYSPGPTVDILAKNDDASELVQVDGHKSYYEDGEIRFTTVQTTRRDDKINLVGAIAAWLDPDRAVIPLDIAHPPDQSAEEEETEGQIQMLSSQDDAIAVALTELGYELDPKIQVAHVTAGTPADGKLQVRDIFLKVNGKEITTGEELVDAIRANGVAQPATFVILRHHRKLTVEITPAMVDGAPRIGVNPGVGYDFPFDVKIQVSEEIGGPSAGLMFSLAVYDTLTPGSLTGGAVVAGTGTISADGRVGPIGGIEQKIAGASDAGAELFFVPADNCPDVADLDPDLELVKATTMHEALIALEAWADDHDANLPRCEE